MIPSGHKTLVRYPDGTSKVITLYARPLEGQIIAHGWEVTKRRARRGRWRWSPDRVPDLGRTPGERVSGDGVGFIRGVGRGNALQVEAANALLRVVLRRVGRLVEPQPFSDLGDEVSHNGDHTPALTRSSCHHSGSRSNPRLGPGCPGPASRRHAASASTSWPSPVRPAGRDGERRDAPTPTAAAPT